MRSTQGEEKVTGSEREKKREGIRVTDVTGSSVAREERESRKEGVKYTEQTGQSECSRERSRSGEIERLKRERKREREMDQCQVNRSVAWREYFFSLLVTAATIAL